MKFKLFILWGLCWTVISFTACKRHKDEPKPTEATAKVLWQEHPEVKFDLKFMNTAKVVGNKLHVAGAYHLLTFNEQHQLERSVKLNETGALHYPPTISNKVITYYDSDAGKLTLYSLENPQISKVVNVNQDAPTGYAFDYNRYYCPFIVINDSEQILVKLYKKESSYTDSLAFLLYQINLTGQNLTVQKEKALYVTTGTQDYTPSITQSFSLGNDFYVSAQYHGTYKINPSGNYEKVADTRFAYPVQLQDTLVVAGQNRDWYMNYTYKTPNQSYWNTEVLDFYDNGYMRFTSINKKMMGFRGDYILQFFTNFQQGKWNAKLIDMEGMTPSVIMKELFVFKDRVYAISLNGVFSKPLQYFFTYKPS